jgi:hypothetical protein
VTSLSQRRVLAVLILIAVMCASMAAGTVRAIEQIAAPSDTSTPIVYYYTEGCSECRAVEQQLEALASTYDFYIYRKVDSLDAAGAKVRSALDTAYGVPDAQRGVAPTVFVGDKVFVREPAIKEGLEKALQESTPQLRQQLLNAWSSAEKGEGTEPSDLFKTFSVLTVIGAGLLDGVNPCAFATLIFFISYLIKRSSPGGTSCLWDWHSPLASSSRTLRLASACTSSCRAPRGSSRSVSGSISSSAFLLPS